MTNLLNKTILQAKDYFYKKDYNNALILFEKEKDFYSVGLCALLLQDVNKARKFFSKSKDINPASDWGLCVLDYIQMKTDKIPTFFQTRAQLEVYINLFIENGLIEWAENLIACADVLYRGNSESYKFIARALFSNGYFDLAITFCKKSLRIFYSDPEAFLIASQCEFLLGNLDNALDYTDKTLAMAPNYYPAQLFKKIIEEEMLKKDKK